VTGPLKTAYAQAGSAAGRGAGALDQLSGQHLVCHRVARQQLEQHLRGHLAQAQLGLVDGGQGRRDELGQLHIIKADDTKLLGHGMPSARQASSAPSAIISL
jgi:hypothetical protein